MRYGVWRECKNESPHRFGLCLSWSHEFTTLTNRNLKVTFCVYTINNRLWTSSKFHKNVSNMPAHKGLCNPELQVTETRRSTFTRNLKSAVVSNAPRGPDAKVLLDERRHGKLNSEATFLEAQDCSWVVPVANEMFVLQHMARGTCCYSLDTLSLERITMDDCTPTHTHTHCVWRHTSTRWKKQAPENISHMSAVNPGLSVVVSGVSGFQRTCRCLWAV